MDWPALILTSVVRRMPAERGEWGAAMLAELAQLQQPFARWQFALGCARVALSPPRRERLLQSIGNNALKNIHANPGSAALIGALFIALRPMLRQRKLYVVNSLLVVFLLVSFAAISVGLGMDIYRCEILRIPNCD